MLAQAEFFRNFRRVCHFQLQKQMQIFQHHPKIWGKRRKKKKNKLWGTQAGFPNFAAMTIPEPIVACTVRDVDGCNSDDMVPPTDDLPNELCCADVKSATEQNCNDEEEMYCVPRAQGAPHPLALGILSWLEACEKEYGASAPKSLPAPIVEAIGPELRRAVAYTKLTYVLDAPISTKVYTATLPGRLEWWYEC